MMISGLMEMDLAQEIKMYTYHFMHLNDQMIQSFVEKLATLYPGVDFEIEYSDPVLDATLEPSDPHLSIT